MEIINELFLTAIGYHMVLLTGYVVRPEQKTEIGKILLYLVWIKLCHLQCHSQVKKIGYDA